MLWYGTEAEKFTDPVIGGVAYPMRHSVLVAGNTTTVSLPTGQHYFIAVSGPGGSSNVVEITL